MIEKVIDHLCDYIKKYTGCPRYFPKLFLNSKMSYEKKVTGQTFFAKLLDGKTFFY